MEVCTTRGHGLRRRLLRRPARDDRPPPRATRPGSARRAARDLARADRDEFLALARESRACTGPGPIRPSARTSSTSSYARSRRDDFLCLLASARTTAAIAGVFTVSQIVRGAFQSAYLGYYAHERHAGQGLMREAMRAGPRPRFGPLGLHRLEANIQPGNAAVDRARARRRLPAGGLLARATC